MTGSQLTTVDFHGAKLIALRGETPSDTLVAMKPVVEGMGMSWAAQFVKIQAHPVLSQGIANIAIPSNGGSQAMTALPLSRLNFWLATIQPNKVPNLETRAKVIQYQTECADVLFAHFFAKATGNDPLTAKETGGIMKAVINKALAEMKAEFDAELADNRKATIELSERVNCLMLAADPRVAGLDYISVKELLDEAKALTKGRKSLQRRMFCALMNRAVTTKPPVQLRRSPHGSKPWLFPRSFAKEFMADVGNGWVADHNAFVSGQGVLNLATERKKRAKAAEAPQPSQGA